MCSYPMRKAREEKITENAFERQLLERLPLVLSTQERYQIFKKEAQSRFQNGVCFASLPCGLMSDLLSLDTHGADDFKFVGIDLDGTAIEQAKAIALVKGLHHSCAFYQMNAWDLDFHNEFDLLTSNGLNIYEEDDERVVDLYKKCF